METAIIAEKINHKSEEAATAAAEAAKNILVKLKNTCFLVAKPIVLRCCNQIQQLIVATASSESI